MIDFAGGGTVRVPTSRSRRLRRYARAAKIGSYVAPALATVCLFLAKADPVWFWLAATVLVLSIALQIGKDWWEKVLEARREPDARSLNITLAQFALTSTSLMTNSDTRRKTLDLCRRYVMQALGREYEEWEGSIATLHILAATDEPTEISVEVGDTRGEKRELLAEALKSGLGAMLVANGDQPQARSFVSVPVRFDGVARGLITLQTSEQYALTRKDVEIVEKYADMLAITFGTERL